MGHAIILILSKGIEITLKKTDLFAILMILNKGSEPIWQI